MTAENGTGSRVRTGLRPGFNEAAADDRGKRPRRGMLRHRLMRFNEAAADDRGKPREDRAITPAPATLQ